LQRSSSATTRHICVQLTFGEVGLMANTNPDTVEIILRIIEQRASQLLAPEDSHVITESVNHVRSGCYSRVRPTEDTWYTVGEHARWIAARLKSISSLLPIVESNVLETGIILGRIYHHMDYRPSKTIRNDLRRSLLGILPPSSQSAVDRKFAAAAKLNSGYAWVARIYACVEREIRWGEL
jgi:hypothetical protein